MADDDAVQHRGLAAPIQWCHFPLLLSLGFGIGFAPDLFVVVMIRKAFQAMKIWGSRADPLDKVRPKSLPLLMIDDLTQDKIDPLNELEIDSAEVLAQQNPFRLLPRVPYDLCLIVDWIAQALLYVLVKDDALQKWRAVYIRNVFDLDIRLKDDQAGQQVCEKPWALPRPPRRPFYGN